ncbi:MAG: DUF805 domain-containing protein [Chitinophagaceae bacterium]
MEKLESDYNMIDWWKKCIFKNYANFRGRARRSEFWYFALFNIILLVPLYMLIWFASVNQNLILSGIAGIMCFVFYLGLLIPYLAVAARRLHDQNKSGWNYLFVLIPFVGSIILLVFFCTDGDRFANNYGEDPKNNGVLEFDFDKNPA